MLTLTFHTDLGHGWLEASCDLVSALGVTVTKYSYQKGDRMYLEEDCDAPRLDAALKAKGIEYKTERKHYEGNHYIRNYQRCV